MDPSNNLDVTLFGEFKQFSQVFAGTTFRANEVRIAVAFLCGKSIMGALISEKLTIKRYKRCSAR